MNRRDRLFNPRRRRLPEGKFSVAVIGFDPVGPRSLQIGVAQESFGESMQRNMSWAGYERALPPEMIPHRLFDRLFGAREEGWVNRKKSILDTVMADASALQKKLPTDDKARVDEHLSGIRDLERAIAGLPPEYTPKWIRRISTAT